MTAKTADPKVEPVEPEIIQPADMPEAREPSTDIVMHTPQGALSLLPGQVHLTTEQKSALVAIGIDTENDPGVEVHVRPFMHMCQIRGIDPFAREAYLIGRGEGRNRKWTMQVAIDGYRRMGSATGRFIRIKKQLWTGSGDDQSMWRETVDSDGDVIMRRVWFDQWPESRGYPGAAKVVIEHYDEHGLITTSEGIADWNFYAPMHQAWHWGERRGDKVMETNADGSPKMVVADMWAKGFQHMLLKCATALAYRNAGLVAGGIYVHEEMHRADQQERMREQREARNRVEQAYQRAVGASVVTSENAEAARTRPVEQEPVRVGVVAGEVVDAIVVEEPLTPEQTVAALHAELAWHAERLDKNKVETLPGVVRTIRSARRNWDKFTVEDLWRAVRIQRPTTALVLREAGQDHLAVLVEHLADDKILTPPQVEASDEPVDATQPHAFVGPEDGICQHCERFLDDVIHPPVA